MFSIPKIVGAIVTLFLFCSLVGRPDIPMKMILSLQTEAYKHLNADWGNPSIFDKSDF